MSPCVGRQSWLKGILRDSLVGSSTLFVTVLLPKRDFIPATALDLVIYCPNAPPYF